MNNVLGATYVGIKVGVYHYSQAISEAEAKKEAEYLIKIISAYKSKISLPVVFDWEFGKRLNSNVAKKLGKSKCNAICKAFCDTVKDAGYTPMVYANLSTFNNYITLSKIRAFAKIWLAQYNSTKGIEDVDWWQYTSSGIVSGIKGRVDMNKVYDNDVAPTPEKKGYAGTFPTIPSYDANGNKINAKALELAWPKGTSSAKWKYPNGSATSAFKSAIEKAYPDRSKWGKAPKLGASCDVFAGTVIRASGIDTGMPRGLEGQFPYFAKSPKWISIANPTNDKLKAGDIIMYYKKGGGAHIAIVVNISGKLYIAEAGYQNCYGHITNSVSSRVSMAGKSKRFVYRAKGIDYISKGDKSEDVKKLQAFLNWYGGYGLEIDGDFGEETDKAVKNYQNKEGLEVDGKFGKLSLVKAKAVNK